MNINQIVAYSIGRRKKAIAQVIFLVGNGKFTINKINANTYLQNNLDYLQRINFFSYNFMQKKNITGNSNEFLF
jgi:ribosomal protein S9